MTTLDDLSAELSSAVRAHAEAEYPRECCGALLGRGGVVTRVQRLTNVAAHPRRAFDVSASELLALHREADAAQLEVVGTYHSHVDAEALPSPADRAAALPGARLVIVAVYGGVAQTPRVWLAEGSK